MKTLFSLVLASGMAFGALAADGIPPELAGEWVTFGAKFNRADLLTNGTAIYVHTNRVAGMVSAPPAPGSPGAVTGLAGTATYDETTATLTVDLRYTDTLKLKVTCLYEAEARTLTADKNPNVKGAGAIRLMRRQKSVPKRVLETLEALK